MGQVHQLSRDYFEPNIKREDFFIKEVFWKDFIESDVHLWTSLYQLCSSSIAFTDIADFYNSRWKCMRKDQSLRFSIKIFFSEAEQTWNFSEWELKQIKEKLAIILLKQYKYIESNQELILKKISKILDAERRKISELYENIWYDENIKH